MKCLNPNCKRKEKSRGLCTTCYDIAAKLVKAGRTTWEKLEGENKAKGSRKKVKITDWLLGQ